MITNSNNNDLRTISNAKVCNYGKASELLARESAQRAHGRTMRIAFWRKGIEQLPKDVQLPQTRTTREQMDNLHERVCYSIPR